MQTDRFFVILICELVMFALLPEFAVQAEPAMGRLPTDNKVAVNETGGSGERTGVGDSDDQAVNDLVVLQGRVADRYTRLEKLLLRLRDFEAAENPRRAKLLEQAFEQATDRYTAKQLETVVRQLSLKQWSGAIKGQERVKDDLLALLELLKSEDRNERIKSDQQRIKEYIQEIERIIRIQKGIRGQTENANDPKKLAKAQGDAADRTRDLDRQIQEDEDGATKDPEARHTDPEANKNDAQETDEEGEKDRPTSGNQRDDPSDQSRSDRKDGKNGEKDQENQDTADRGNQKKAAPDKEQEDADRREKGSKDRPSDSQSGDQDESQKMQGENSQGEPRPGDHENNGRSDTDQKPRQSNPSQDNPVRQRIQAAEQRMREAQRKLDEAKRNESVKEMEEAEKELAQAKRELEEILRQLREEEVERVLAQLEGRFREMLERELRVYDGTKRLAVIPENQRGSEIDIQAAQLGIEQYKIAVEADKALVLLLEEGSSIAFPETVEQLRDDMERVSQRLARTKIDSITQQLEEEIIDTLNFIIEALVQAQEDLEQKEQNQPPPQMMQPEDQPLVDALAELRLIRALQERVNKRHERYAQLLDDPDDPVGLTDDPDLRDALERLAERQESIHRITRDLVLGKNR